MNRRNFVAGCAALGLCPRLIRAAGAAGLPEFARTDFAGSADPAYIANGMIGLRPGPNPLAPALATAAGYVYLHPRFRVEALSPAPWPLTVDIRTDRGGLLANPERVRTKRQAIDMATGELTTDMLYEEAGGRRFAVQVVQFASRATPSLVCQEIVVTPASGMDLEFAPEIRAEGVPGTVSNDVKPDLTPLDLAVRVDSGGNLSRLGIAVAVLAPAPFERQPAGLPWRVKAQAGAPLRFRTVAALVSSFYHPAPELQAIRMAEWGRMLGWDTLREQNRAAWRELWRSRVRITGDEDDQKALDAAFFYLHSSVHRSNRNGMPPFGLSQVSHYYGHSFWDTETWSLLPVLLASPAAARSLLEFRRRGLQAAERLADLFGYEGAHFPWEAGQLDGSETTPTFAATGWAEHHVVPDIALAFWQYQMATGDREFLRAATWPVLRGVAQWILSRGVRTSAGFEIRNIMGPNEQINNIANSAFVNLASRAVLRAAERCASLVGETPPRAWGETAAAIVLPVDRERGVLLTFDGARDDGFADLTFLLAFDVSVEPQLFERTWKAYSARRDREHNIGFATAPQAAGAAFAGDRKQAAALFRAAWKENWLEPFGMIREVPWHSYGCFVTTFGSMLQTAMIGFTGLRIGEDEWAKYPASLPENWSRIEVDRIWVRGEPRRLTAEHGSKARLLPAAV